MRPVLLSLPLGLLPALAPTLSLAEVPKVVTDIPAVHSIVAQVMGDLGAPAVLLEQGGNAHNYQMKPSQARALQDADLVFWIGPEMTPWLARAIDGVALNGTAVELIEAPGTLRRDFGGALHEGHAEEGHAEAGHDHETEDHAEDHAGHDHAGEEHAAEAHAGHDHDAHGAEAEPGHTKADPAAADADHDHDPAHSGLDPHAWLDPGNAATWAGLIAERLAAADPENAATYAANAEATRARLAALDASLRAELAPVAATPFVVFHDAYGYFAAHYGLNVAGAIALGDAAEPGAGHLAELRADLGARGVRCVFPEAQHDPKRVDLLVEGTAARVGGTLDPSGSSLTYGPELYGTLMQGLADTLQGCLSAP